MHSIGLQSTAWWKLDIATRASNSMRGRNHYRRSRAARQLFMRDMSRASDSSGIAIVGIGCRFPGKANSPEEFWKLLRDGVDAITEFPPERFDLEGAFDADPATPGKMYIRRGGTMDNVDRFDPEFFGISPREARHIDPQQRLLLEVAYEATGDRYAPDRLLSAQPVPGLRWLTDYSATVPELLTEWDMAFGPVAPPPGGVAEPRGRYGRT